jgi:hypothetical protein
MDYKSWTGDTQFVRPAYAELHKDTRQSTSYTLDEIMWQTHWMSTDGNWEEEGSVRGMKECLTSEGYAAFLAALSNACLIEDEPFSIGPYTMELASILADTPFADIRKHLLPMQANGELLAELLPQIT